MKAVIIEEARRPGVREIPELKIRPDYIKIKTVAVAVNPSWYLPEFIP
jgi:NADPH:quinone reductase-like Zn-dependent oxidoreductase